MFIQILLRFSILIYSSSNTLFNRIDGIDILMSCDELVNFLNIPNK